VARQHIKAQRQRHGQPGPAGAPERQQNRRECDPDLAVGTGLIEKHRQCIQHRTAQSLQGIQKGKFKGHG
jgi:hypothetical protein